MNTQTFHNLKLSTRWILWQHSSTEFDLADSTTFLDTSLYIPVVSKWVSKHDIQLYTPRWVLRHYVGKHVHTPPLSQKHHPCWVGSVRVAERLAPPTSDHGVAGSNPAGGEILPEPKWRFIAQSLSCSPFHRLEMTEILLKGRKTLIHPSILSGWAGRGSSIGSVSAWHASGPEFDPNVRHIRSGRLWSWKNFKCHSPSSADSRRAVVSYWRKNVH